MIFYAADGKAFQAAGKALSFPLAKQKRPQDAAAPVSPLSPAVQDAAGF